MLTLDRYVPSMRNLKAHLKGVDSRILLGASSWWHVNQHGKPAKRTITLIDKMDEVLLEIPRVREDLGFIPVSDTNITNCRHPGGVKYFDSVSAIRSIAPKSLHGVS